MLKDKGLCFRVLCVFYAIYIEKSSTPNTSVNFGEIMGNPAVEVDSLVKRYGQLVAVDHISFEVYEGEIFRAPRPKRRSSCEKRIYDRQLSFLFKSSW